jgi:hypothetical protein
MKSQIQKKKSQLYKTVILPAVLCGSESWTLSKADEAVLEGFERRILKRIYGAVQIDEVIIRNYTVYLMMLI